MNGVLKYMYTDYNTADQYKTARYTKTHSYCCFSIQMMFLPLLASITTVATTTAVTTDITIVTTLLL